MISSHKIRAGTSVIDSRFYHGEQTFKNCGRSWVRDCHKGKEVGAWEESLTVPFKVFAQVKPEFVRKSEKLGIFSHSSG